MTSNQEKALNLMEELENAGFGGSKADSIDSQEDFTATLYTNPAIRLNFSDVDDITSFNNKELHASTPLINLGCAPVECDDVTVDSNVFKGYTQKIMKPPTPLKKNVKPVFSSDMTTPPRRVGLNLEEELQQAVSHNDKNIGKALVKDDQGLFSPCTNEGLSLEQELQQALPHKEKNIEKSLVKDGLFSPCTNEGLSLEQELQQALPHSEKNIEKSLVKDGLFSPCTNEGLSLEQELQQALPHKEKNIEKSLVKDGLFSPCTNEGLSLEQELQQALPHKEKNIEKSLVKDGLFSPCTNEGLSLEQELQQAVSHYETNNKQMIELSMTSHSIGSPVETNFSFRNANLSLEEKPEYQQTFAHDINAVKSEGNLKNDLASSKIQSGNSINIELNHDFDLTEPHKKTGLDVEEEPKPLTSDDLSHTEYSLQNELSRSKVLVSECSSIGLGMEQKLQQATIQNREENDVNRLDSSQQLKSALEDVDFSLHEELSENRDLNVDDNSSPLKASLNSSTSNPASTKEAHTDSQNELSNQQKVLTELGGELTDKDFSNLEKKMEISISGETLDSMQEPEGANQSPLQNLIDKNTSKDCKESECLSKNDDPIPVSKDGPELLNTLEYLGFEKQKLESLPGSNISGKEFCVDSQESLVELVEGSQTNEKPESVGVGKKRSLTTDETSSCWTAKSSPEKKTKTDSEIGHESEKDSPRTGTESYFGLVEAKASTEALACAVLKKQIEILEKKLENEQQLTTQAAELGMQVLQENNDLKDKVEKLTSKLAAAEEERENERHAIKLRLQNKDYMEQQYNEEISHLKKEISNLKQSLETSEKTEKALSRQVRSLEYSSEQSQLKEQQLCTTIEHLEKLLQEKAEQPIPTYTLNQTDNSDADEQISALQQEITDMRNNNTMLKSQLISHEAKIKNLKEELLLCEQSKEKEIDEMKCEMNSYHKTLEHSQTEILDLKAQLHAAQIENVNRKDRGNSLFSEIEDRRVLAEKMVAKLQNNYDALKERFDVEKQQHHKLKMQSVCLINMNSAKVYDDHVKQLNSMLQRVNEEKAELLAKLEDYQKTQTQQAEKILKIQKTFGTNKNDDFIDFLNSCNDMKQKELKDLKAKLQHSEMKYLEESCKVVDHIKKLRLIEDEVQSLRRTNMKLKFRIEEVLMKYNPEELLSDGEKPRKTHVEKLPLGPSENIAQALMKQQPTKSKSQAKVSTENPPKCEAQRIAELVRCGAINPADLLKDSPKAKKSVSLSSHVTVIDQDGKTDERVSLANENTAPSTLQKRPARPRGKVISPDKIIEVKSPVHGRIQDCKQQ